MNPRRKRVPPGQRKAEILSAAINLASRIGYQNITRETVAAEAHTSCALVTWYFTNMDILKSVIMRTAISEEILPIIAQGLSVGDEKVASISLALKKKAIAFLKG